MRLDTRNLRRYKVSPTNPNEVRYDCPFCMAKGKLWANFKKFQWVCFRCSAHGSILKRDIVEIRGEAPRFKDEPVKEFDWQNHVDLRGSALRYLKERNIEPDVALMWGWRSGKGAAMHRIIIPVRRYRERYGVETVFRVAHATTKVEPKELQSGSRFPLVLAWGQDDGPCYLDRYPGRTAVIVEGAADAMRLACAARSDSKLRGHVATVCLWGKTIDEDTAFFLGRAFDHHYVVLDREEEAKTGGEILASMKLCAILNAIADGQVARHVWSAKEASATDPAEMSDRAASFTLHSALRATGG